MRPIRPAPRATTTSPSGRFRLTCDGRTWLLWDCWANRPVRVGQLTAPLGEGHSLELDDAGRLRVRSGASFATSCGRSEVVARWGRWLAVGAVLAILAAAHGLPAAAVGVAAATLTRTAWARVRRFRLTLSIDGGSRRG